MFSKKANDVHYRDVLRVCMPLMMSTAAVTVMEFTDRVFLSHYSLEAISAATPAGVVALLFIAFFSGVSGYASVFIAQYMGAGAFHRVGAALWQAIYFSLFSAIVFLGLSFLAEPIFMLGGHAMEIQRQEVIYFRILCLGAVIHVTEAGLASFFTGRGMTRPVMIANIAGMLVNIPLDYALINGLWLFPELGIAGAGIATVASWGVILFLYIAIIFRKNHDLQFQVRRAKAFDPDLFTRLMKYGIPGGLQFCLDLTAFIFFIFMVGRIGTIELAASNIVIAINSLAFMPCLGFSQGVSTLVGQALGMSKPLIAKAAVRKAIHLVMAYTMVVDLLYLFAPRWIIALFMPAESLSADYLGISHVTAGLLRIVAVYIFMDALYMTFVGALRGAGDTRFIMWSIGLASLMVMIIPSYIIIEVFHLGIYAAWVCVLMFIAALFLICAFRYRNGKWQTMRVVEQEVLGPAL